MKKVLAEEKVRPSRKYGIDYGAIARHLGPCPGSMEEYQIDHIFSLTAFDLKQDSHVRAAFAPQNHQWLTVSANLSKSGRFDISAFQKYLKEFTECE